MRPEPVTVASLLQDSESLLAQAGVDSPRLSAQVLIAHILGIDRHVMLLDRSRELDSAQVQAIRSLVDRRATGEPVAYLVGVKEFYGLDFQVSAAVLVPRWETELIVEEVVQRFGAGAPVVFADLGTGSGCLAVTIAHELPKAAGLALDTSAEALDVARSNALANGVAHRVQFAQADFGRPFAEEGAFDLVVSNPPYVSDEEYRGTSHEVHDFEPRSALVPDVEGESDGLECYRALVPRAASVLRSGGVLLMEIGWLQGEAVSSLVHSGGCFHDVLVLQDLAGKDRVVSAVRL